MMAKIAPNRRRCQSCGRVLWLVRKGMYVWLHCVGCDNARI